MNRHKSDVKKIEIYIFARDQSIPILGFNGYGIYYLYGFNKENPHKNTAKTKTHK
jgi:hypothetical protein